MRTITHDQHDQHTVSLLGKNRSNESAFRIPKDAPARARFHPPRNAPARPTPDDAENTSRALARANALPHANARRANARRTTTYLHQITAPSLDRHLSRAPVHAARARHPLHHRPRGVQRPPRAPRRARGRQLGARPAHRGHRRRRRRVRRPRGRVLSGAPDIRLTSHNPTSRMEWVHTTPHASVCTHSHRAHDQSRSYNTPYVRKLRSYISGVTFKRRKFARVVASTAFHGRTPRSTADRGHTQPWRTS